MYAKVGVGVTEQTRHWYCKSSVFYWTGRHNRQLLYQTIITHWTTTFFIVYQYAIDDSPLSETIFYEYAN